MTKPRDKRPEGGDILDRIEKDLADPAYRARMRRAFAGLSAVELVKEIRREMEQKRRERSERARRRRASRE